MILHTARHLLPLAFCAPLLANAAPITLEQALQQAGDGQAGAAINAELQARYAAQQQRESESGWEVFGNANAGRYHELVTEDVRDDYYGRNAAIGVRYPLLGSLARRLEAVHASERDVRLGRIQQQYQRARQRLAVRSAYADWWRASQEQQLCEGVQAAASTAETQLRTRLEGKWILPSDARLMRSEWSAVTRRCALQADLLADVRASLQSLGVAISPGDTPVAAPLAAHPQALEAWRNQLQGNPRMARRDAELALAEQGRERPWYSAIDSYFNVTQTVEERSGAADRGSGLSVGVTFSAPLDLLDYGSARSREGEARYQAAVQAKEAEHGTLLRELGKVIEQQRRNANEYAWRSERREALERIVAERRQRSSLDAGEASLRLQQAEVDRYNAGFAQIAAWHATWLQDAALRLFGDDSPAFQALLGKQWLRWQSGATGPVARTGNWRLGTYAWQSQRLLAAATQASELQALRKAGIGIIHLGLDARQIQNLPATRANLSALLGAAHRQGLQVNLLLGDPAWIKPQHRAQLLELLGQLRELPFDGLHLDLEVEQLGWPVPDQRLHDWLETLRQAKAASPWPVQLSSHPRWFQAQAKRSPCVPCELQRLGIEDVSLMIYTRNAQASSTRAVEIARAWPGLHMRLAQSVEPDQPAALSWADAGSSQLQAQADTWKHTLLPAGISGIDWQSWTDYPRSR
ncbi:hypothetical protein F3J45_12510 [Pantoea sp. Ap-967]|uniref:hypothetical protein n=1 Tax=Pantoea sp. Ap-967 TaxID=2608362 RepID=UPI00142092AB|nr:hypothetical protein [Pantoea sp. Ap-967]NIE75260.1 hypothetical protein [Pantoea sp. Ap-967]